MELNARLTDFYKKHLPGSVIDGTTLKGPCPFCKTKGRKEAGSIVVYLGARSYFAGYFRCQNRCLPGGFMAHFARLSGIDPASVPGYDPDREPFVQSLKFPAGNINQDIRSYQDKLTPNTQTYFAKIGVGAGTLTELKIGYNGRYIVYPYFMQNGNCYTAHCIMPENETEQFWHGDQSFATNGLQIFNISDIDYCEDGALFVVEGEQNLLCLRELGFPGIAVPSADDLHGIDIKRFEYIQTLFMVMNHSPESLEAARTFAEQLGFKVRLLHWPPQKKRGFNLAQLASEDPENFRAQVSKMVNGSRAFSPFRSPGHEYELFLDNIKRQHSESYLAMQTGMAGYDEAVGGIYGLNILGGPPKAGKSCLGIQIGTEIARKNVGVLYYDFENGTQKIYQRTLSRLSRVPVDKIVSAQLADEETNRLADAQTELQNMLQFFRVVNDRQINPVIMRRHVDFLRHETRRDNILVVIDSLHKLPFKDFTERRTGINAWLRELESIRDELQVGFLIISELTRQESGRYDGVPHMGLFKDSSDIEYTADNAMVFLPEWEAIDIKAGAERINSLWLVASRENSPGLIARYHLDFPYWGFSEIKK
ncbi:MAG: DNA helicase [Desulfobacterales bacterium SG8_35_2]|jgi:replicative DNA helicase|nr:MAG: DNA helicase [Desulfobacterales bacterium SG8_35_2]